MKRILTLLSLVVCCFFLATPVWAAKKEKEKDNEKPVVKFGAKTHKAFMLHSIPKCGTHLFQRLVWLMTGRDIVNVMDVDESSLWMGYATGKVYRLHLEYRPDLLNHIVNPWGHRMLCMVRDPRDALVSHAFYMNSERFLGKRQRDFFWVNEATYDQLSFDEQITSLITGSEHSPSYLNYYKVRTDWASSGLTLPVYFEEIIGSQGGGDDRVQRNAILRIAKYINLKLTKHEIAKIQECLYRPPGTDVQQGDQTFERGHLGNWKKFLTEEHKALIKERYGQLLIDLGYEKDTNW